MNINRRKFIRNIAGVTAGIALFPYDKTFTREAIRSTDSVPNPALWKDTDLNIAWIGHSTVLINLYGTIILTDPVLFERVGLYILGATFGPARFTAPALDIDQIPKPDLILLSHAHMDHMDYATLLHLSDLYPRQIDVITAYNTADVISELKWKSLTEMDWREEFEIHNIKFKALEVQHFGWRYPWEKDRSKGFMTDGRSYNAYTLSKNGRTILFGGDTAYTEKFKEQINEKIDVVIMPIGAYYPWRRNHCTPEEALVMAAEHLNADFFIPIHCNTLRQGREPIDEPLTWLVDSSVNYNIELGIKNIGETLTLEV
jgi:L-ascorbate metabolism protein UlaG (beta-lactamase superfamily)